MLVNATSLQTLFVGFNTKFNEAFAAAAKELYYPKLTMRVDSSNRQETHGWLGQFPMLREWLGSRHIKNLEAHSFTILNRMFESTIEVDRNDIEDDLFGIYAPTVAEMGRNAAMHPDLLLAELINAGFATACYDGQYFFDIDHPVRDKNDAVQSVSNFQGGAGTPWFLIDGRREIKPFLWQVRVPYDFAALDRETDENVFFQNKFIYGTRARVNVGFGLWQFAYASKQTLNAANYESARAAMMAITGDAGTPLGIKPTHLLVGPSLEGEARRLLNNGSRVESTDGALTDRVAIANEWAGSAELIVSPYLT